MEKISYQTSALIDWLAFQCLWNENFSFFHGGNIDWRTQKLFEILKLNPMEASKPVTNPAGKLGYQQSYIYDEDLVLGFDVRDFAKIKYAKKQFIISMSGSACRHFEARGGSFEELFTFLSQLEGDDDNPEMVRFNRCDLAMDDINGFLEIDKLKRKLRAGDFTCPFRSNKENGRRGDEMYTLDYESNPFDLDNPKVIDTKYGYSFTLGNHGSSQELQIYDKKAERENKGYNVGIESWIRFEARITSKRCDHMCKELLPEVFETKTFGSFVCSVMAGLIDIKIHDKNMCNTRNKNKLKTWEPYQRFLNSAKKISLPCCQFKVEQTVERSLRWAKTDWIKALISFFGTVGDPMNDLMYQIVEFMKDKKKGIDSQLVSRCKNYAIRNGVKMTTEDVLEQIQSFIDSSYTGSNATGLDLKKLYYAKYPDEKPTALNDPELAFDVSGLV